MTTTTAEIAPDAIADTLARAADHLDRVGWHQGWIYDISQADTGTPIADCRVCIAGALATAIYGQPRYGGEENTSQVELMMAAEEAVQRHLGQDFIQWNDTRGRTKAEVTTALRDTAAGLRGAAA